MIAGKGSSTFKVYNALNLRFNIEMLIVENNPSTKKFLARRAKRLGYFKVFGQVLFQAIAQKILNMTSKKRIAEITEKYGFDSTPPRREKLVEINSINDNASIELLKELNPDIIIVNGTRIIGKNVLENINATFINTHAGITPKYRGCHGGYWSLVNNDIGHCGVTVHLVDKGIDTGEVIYQALIRPEKKDNFITYTYLQLGEGIKIMKNAISDELAGNLRTISPMTNESKLWHHPTIWFYLYNRICKGIK